jgi:hypothetical protein
MTRDDIDKLWNQALDQSIAAGEKFTRYSFVELINREMIRDGWRQCAEGQKTTQFCGQLEAAVKAEREACARVCEGMARSIDDEILSDAQWIASSCVRAIRARKGVKP